MKRSVLLTGIAMLIAGIASAEPSGDPFEGKLRPIKPGWTMSSEEVTRYALPYLNRVSACYKRHAATDRRATGELFLYVVISSKGNVVYHETTAPGVGGVRYLRLDRCIVKELAAWHFPMRKGFTNAIIPYFFLQTRAPASGPFPGCWNPKGCPETPDRPPPKTT